MISVTHGHERIEYSQSRAINKPASMSDPEYPQRTPGQQEDPRRTVEHRHGTRLSSASLEGPHGRNDSGKET